MCRHCLRFIQLRAVSARQAKRAAHFIGYNLLGNFNDISGHIFFGIFIIYRDGCIVSRVVCNRVERVGYIRIVEIYISINSIDAAFIAILPQFIPAGCRTARAPARDPRIISLVDQLLPRKPCLRITVACVEAGLCSQKLFCGVHTGTNSLCTRLIRSMPLQPVHILIVNEERHIQNNPGIFQIVPFRRIRNELNFLQSFVAVKRLAEPICAYQQTGCFGTIHVLDKHRVHNIVVCAVAPMHCADNYKINTVCFHLRPINNTLCAGNINSFHLGKTDQYTMLISLICFAIDRHNFVYNNSAITHEIITIVVFCNTIPDSRASFIKETILLRNPVRA